MVAQQAPLSMGFSRQECWYGFPFPSPEDLPDPGIEPRSPALQADSLPSEPPGKHQVFLVGSKRNVLPIVVVEHGVCWLLNLKYQFRLPGQGQVQSSVCPKSKISGGVFNLGQVPTLGQPAVVRAANRSIPGVGSGNQTISSLSKDYIRTLPFLPLLFI